MLWVRVLGAILIWLLSLYSIVALRTQQRGTGTKSYQISPKPCEVNNLKGTCMFVWECIKSEGEHLGMCVDSFMFGSCCSHNQDSNSISHGSSGDHESDTDDDGPGIPHYHQQNSNGDGPHILYSPPDSSINQHQHWTEQTVTTHRYTSTTRRPTTRPIVNNLGSNNFYITSHQNKPSTSDHKPANNHIDISSSVTIKPSSAFSSSFITSGSSTQSTIIKESTTELSTSLLSSASSPPRVGSTSSSSHRPGSGSVWQVTTEPNFITKPRPNISSSYKPTTNVKPSKKPVTTTTQTYQKPKPIISKPFNQSMITTLNLIQQQHNKKPIITHPNISGPNYMPGDINFDPKPPMLTMNLGGAATPGDFEQQTPSPTSDSMMPTSTLISVAAATSGDRTARCGVTTLFPRPEKRIVGGKNAQLGRWPWQVSVRRTSFFGFSSTHRCGGAVLNENWIATAGHCVDDLLTSQIRIRVGEYDFSKQQEEFPFVERMVAKKVVHPKYNFFTYEYDLALVRLDKPLDFAPHIAPICLPASDDLLIGENATVTGWGRLSEGGTLPSVLQEVQVPIVSNDRCKSMFLRAGRHEFIPEIFLCAGHEGGGMDSCQGDSGGPLQVKGKDGRFFLAGIISWGIGCAEANLPGVCTRISKFVPWILENVT